MIIRVITLRIPAISILSMNKYTKCLLFAASTIIVSGFTSSVNQAIAQPNYSPTAVQELETNGTFPSITFPSTPNPAQIQQKQETELHHEQEMLPNLRENWQEQEEQLQQEQEAEVPENVDNPGHAAPGNETPEQDTPDELEIPL